MQKTFQTTGDAAARGRGKFVSGRKFIAVALAINGAALTAPQAQAAPDGGQVSAGSGAITRTGAATVISQHSQNLAIDWNSFSIAANETVRFNQPNASAIALNRVTGASPSQIFGSLGANGQVFILNPNGILFGNTAQVNVGGLVASTLSLDNTDFMAGNYRFSNNGNPAGILNQGSLTAANGGYIALLAPEVRNEGIITATLGTALLGAGNKVTLNFNNGSLLGYSIDQGALNALAENRQLIQADGGQVIMSARAANALSAAVVNNTGVIEARTVQNRSGIITLLGDMQAGQVNVGGTLDASAPGGGDGGFIETSAAHVKIANDARVTTAAPQGKSGNWLIDPVDYTIAATGGDITGATLGSNLDLGNVTVTNAAGAGNGDIFVNDAVSWNANTTLTLSASRHVKVNANITASGATAGLALTPGAGGAYSLNNGAVITLSGSNPSLSIAGVAYTVINSLGVAGDASTTTLQGIKNAPAGRYALGSDIDAAATSTWNAGAGFAPVSNSVTQFTGTFDGLGHTIGNLYINLPGTGYVGLFGYVGGAAVVRNVGLVGGSVKGSNFTGGLAGSLFGTISNSYATGSVNGASYVGGLVGMKFGTVSNSYATGSVSGASYVGGLVGFNSGSTSNSYATGSVSGSSSQIGGLAGYNSGSISSSYATGSVSGASYVGGLVGRNFSSVSNSFWDITTSGQATSAGGRGLTTTQMMTQANFISATAANGNVNPAWDFSTPVWASYSGHTYPLLASFLKPLTVTTSTASVVYSGSAPSASASGVSYSDTTALASGHLLGSAPYSAPINTGSYTPVQGYWSDQQGYNISWINNGALTITPAPLTITANATSKTYDGLAYAGNNGVSYSGLVNGETPAILSGTLGYGGSAQGAINAGSYLITPGGLTSGNYAINYVDGALTIAPAPLTITANGFSKFYDGIAYQGGNGIVYSGFVNGEAPAILNGTLDYGGTAQGAVNAGNYPITPNGLTGANYAITFTDGVLTIKPANQAATFLGGNTLETAYNDAQNGVHGAGKNVAGGRSEKQASLAAGKSGVQSQAQGNSRIAIVNCGVRMPAGTPTYTCQ